MQESKIVILFQKRRNFWINDSTVLKKWIAYDFSSFCNSYLFFFIKTYKKCIFKSQINQNRITFKAFFKIFYFKMKMFI